MIQLISVFHYIGSQLAAGKQIDIIYLDMSKAFDKVDHSKLLRRLHQYGITGKLHDWFRSYLQVRKQQACHLVVVVELVCLNDPKSYAGGDLVPGGFNRTGLVEG